MTPKGAWSPNLNREVIMIIDIYPDLGFVLPESSRWNATHDVARMVRYDPDPDGVAVACEEAGYRVLVTNYALSEVFRVNDVSLTDVRKTVESTDSNRVFYIQYDEETFCIHAEEPSTHFVGIIEVGDAVEDRTAKLNELNSQFTNKRIKAFVDGLVYEAMIVEDGKITISCSGLDDLQEAKTYYERYLPECMYSDRDFEQVGDNFILKYEERY